MTKSFRYIQREKSDKHAYNKDTSNFKNKAQDKLVLSLSLFNGQIKGLTESLPEIY